jgi:uracil-DNA glycosylase
MTTGSTPGGTAATADQLRALIPSGWWAAIEGIIPEAKLEQLARGLSDERRVIVPTAREHWLRALDITPLTAVRAVIIGQDPYPNREQAEGLAFSVPDGVRPVPPSLIRILNEARREGTIVPGRTSLLPWAAERGVLLLNTVLTVPEGKARGHAKIGWQPLTEAILRAVASQRRPVVFMPWGVHARETVEAVMRSHIEGGLPHIVWPSVHPMERRGSFIGSNPFGCVNDRLRAAGLDRIVWSLD